MSPLADPERVHDALSHATLEHRAGWLAGLVRRFGNDFERAEDAISDACAEALVLWTQRGIPDDPGAWIAVVARRRLADALRRRSGAKRDIDDGSEEHDGEGPTDSMVRDARIDFGSGDDTLRLVFTCCHPALATESRVALTLNAVSGLDAAAIARAFLVDEGAMAKRLTRAKHKIRDAAIPFGVLSPHDVPERVPHVLKTIELIFNEGYAQARGEDLDAPSLSEEALRLAEELARMLPHEVEAAGLRALILFTHARRDARVDGHGRLVPLPEQDRARWNQAMIREGRRVLSGAVQRGGSGPYILRAALSAEHSTAASADVTRWDRVVGLYDALLEQEPSPVVELNRAVAVGERDGPEAMLRALDAIDGDLDRFQYAHVVRAEALARMGRRPEARAAFGLAIDRAANDVERAHLRRRRDSLE